MSVGGVVGDHAEVSVGQDLRASASSIARLGVFLRTRHRRAFWIGTLAAMGCAVVIAASRPLWFDEIFTWQIATRPTLGGLIAALGPMDPSPPLNYLLVRGAHGLFGTGPLATRLPALLSFLVTLVVLHRLVVPLAGPLFALAVVATLPLTPALTYAAEARPYALLLACSAISLLAWLEVTRGGRRRLGIAGLLLSLTAALYAHFYAFLLFVPIAVGEAVRTWTRGRVDLAVWVALAAAVALALPLLPLVQACLVVRTTFWAVPTLTRLGLALQVFASIALVALMATLVGLIARSLSTGLEASREPPPPAAPAHEIAAAAALASLPLIAFLVARLATNAYDGRYVLPSVLGGLLLLAHGSRLLRHRRTEVATVLLAAVCLLASVNSILHARRALIAPLPTVPLPLPAHEPGPVVVADPFKFTQTVHAAPETRNRLVYLIDHLSHPDFPESSTDVSVRGLGALLALHVEDFDRFVATHDRFWVVDDTGRWTARLGAENTQGRHELAATVGGVQLWTR